MKYWIGQPNTFYQLNMDKTHLRNGVLIYLATVDRKFAIIGDAGYKQRCAC